MRSSLAADPSSVAALLGSPGVLIYPDVNSVRHSTQNHHHESASTARLMREKSACRSTGVAEEHRGDGDAAALVVPRSGGAVLREINIGNV